MPKLLKILSKYLLFLVLASFTFFLTFNGLEVMSSLNTNFTSTVEKMENSSVIDNIIAENSDPIFPKDYKNIHNVDLVPDQLSFDSLNSDVYLSPSRHIDNQWYTRTFNAHYIPLNQDLEKHNKDYLIYTRNHWRAVSNIDKLQKGDNISLIGKQGDRTTFSIQTISLEPKGEEYVLPRNNRKQILLLIENIQENSYYAINAVLIK